MLREQRLMFAYRNKSGEKRGSQILFEDIVYAGLERRAVPSIAIPVNGKAVTDAVFSMNDHETFVVNGMSIGGQKIKELFCILPFLQHIEDRFPNTDIYVCIPNENIEDGTDISIHVTKPDTAIPEVPSSIGESVSKVDSENLIATLDIQVKEDAEPFLYAKHATSKIVTPSQLDLNKVNEYGRAYSDKFVLVFCRKSGILNTIEWNQGIKGSNVFAVSIPDTSIRSVTSSDGSKTFYFPSDGFNFLLLIPPTLGVPTVHHAFFKRPGYLLTEPPIPPHRLTPG